MRPTVFQKAELRDENDNIIQQGTYGKGSVLSNSTNDAWIDYVMNNLEALYGIAKDEVVPVSALPASGDMNKTYLLTTTGVCYRWDGTAWVEISSSEAVGRAETAANLAEQWATKTDGTVADNEYSAKYYANAAQQSADDAQDVADDMADHLAQIDENTGGVSANSKRIGNIEKLLQGNLYDYDTDDDTAYTKTVPSGALPYAGVEKIGGKTVVWNQLVGNGNFAYATGWEALNSTLSVSNNEADITAGSSGSEAVLRTVLKTKTIIGHKYYFRCVTATTQQSRFYVSIAGASATGNAVDFGYIDPNEWKVCSGFLVPTIESSYLYLQYNRYDSTVYKFKNVKVIDLTLAFGSGNEPSTTAEVEAMFPAETYEYNKGTLMSAGVTSVVSKCENLLDITQVVQGTISNSGVNQDGDDVAKTRLRTPFIQVIEGETYTISCKAGSTADDRILVYEVDFYNATTGWTQHSFQAINAFSDDITIPNGIHYIKVLFRKANSTVITPDELQDPLVVKKSTYFDISYPIPAEVQALEGYGWSAGSVYNYVDFERKVFVKNVARVVLDGTQYLRLVNYQPLANSVGWLYSYDTFSPAIKTCDREVVGNVVADTLVPTSDAVINETNGNFISVPRTTPYGFIVRYMDTSLNNATAINNFLSANPITVYYEMATPQEIDISQYLTDDNLIEVEANGTLTFPNSNGDDYRIPVPSEETYMIDLQEAINNG